MRRIQIQDPPRADQVDAVVESIRAGQVVVLPTETVYGLAADATPAGAQALAAVKGRPEDRPFTHHLADTADLDTVAGPVPVRIRRLLDRSWPGPLTAILAGAKGSADVGVRVPAHSFTRAVIQAMGHSLFMTSANSSGEPPIHDPDEIATAFAADSRVAILAEDGPPRLGDPSAIVRLRGRELEVVRPGLLSADELRRGAAATVLFVCTGNTCRSPMAEALARRLAAEHLGIEVDQVLAHGLWFRSAGTATLPGMPASSGSIAAAQEIDLPLESHRSTSLSTELIEASDRIYCLSASHLADVVDSHPDAGDRTSLLRADGQNVTDPFGGPLDVYRSTRVELEALLRARLEEIIGLLG